MNRRAQIYKMFILSLIVVIVILPLALIIAEQKRKKFDGFLGEPDITILRTYEKGEKVLFYVDESARLSAREAMYATGRKGLQPDGTCSYSGDVAIWADEVAQSTCFPDPGTAIGFFEDTFKANLDRHLQGYEGLPEIGYGIELVREGPRIELIGRTDDRIAIAVSQDDAIHIRKEVALSDEEIAREIEEGISGSKSEDERIIGYYKANPSFATYIEFRNATIERTISSARTFHQEMGRMIRSQGGANLTDEMVRAMIESDPSLYEGWHEGDCPGYAREEADDGIAVICADTGIMTYVYDTRTRKFSEVPIGILFAMRFY